MQGIVAEEMAGETGRRTAGRRTGPKARSVHGSSDLPTILQSAEGAALLHASSIRPAKLPKDEQARVTPLDDLPIGNDFAQPALGLLTGSEPGVSACGRFLSPSKDEPRLTSGILARMRFHG
jgi:hypothetical protein